MAENLNFNRAPYYDDYEVNKRFLKILARPEFGVQSREINQIQTMFQQQIERFGDHVFKNGSKVLGGEIKIDEDVSYLKIQETFFDENGASEASLSQNSLNLLHNAIIRNDSVGNPDGTLAARIVTTKLSENGDTSTLFLKSLQNDTALPESDTFDQNVLLSVYKEVDKQYSTTAEFSNNRADWVGKLVYVTEIEKIQTVVFDDAQNQFVIQDTGLGGTTFNTDLQAVLVEHLKTDPSDPNYVGKSLLVHVSAGVYYVNGYFSVTDDGTAIAGKYTNTPSVSIGFDIDEDIITEDDDSSLNDQALGSSNEGAAGAHRFYMGLELAVKDFDDVDEGLITDGTDYIQLIRIKEGETLSVVREAQYNELASTLARRTYDESGNYVVNRFPISVHEHLDDGTNNGIFEAPAGDSDLIAIGVGQGKAYVHGFEVENQSTLFLETEKAYDSAHQKISENNYIHIDLGNYVVGTIVSGDTPEWSQHPAMSLRGVGNSVIGTANIRGIIKDVADPAKVRVYLFNIKMNTGQSFDSVDNIITSPAGVDDMLINGLTQHNGVPTIFKPTKNVNIFPLPFSNVSTVSDVSAQYIKHQSQTSTSDGGSHKTQWTTSTGKFDVSAESEYVLYDQTNDQIVQATGTFSNLDTIYTITGLPNVSTDYTLSYKEIATATGAKAKTHNVGSKLSHVISGSETSISLAKADIVKIQSIKISVGANTGLDITNRFTLDNGQRDSYYDIGKVLLKAGQSLSPWTGQTLEVTFDYMSHSGNTFFSPKTYQTLSGVSALYTTSSGVTINLKDAFDYRPTINSAGTGFTGTGSRSSLIPYPNSSAIADITYYVGRKDKLYVGHDGIFGINTGVPAVDPLAPEDKENSITLCEIDIPAGVSSTTEDIKIKEINNRRYTMADLRSIEARVDNVEYYTSLSLLEKETNERKLLDATGQDRFKNGFVVDAFSDHKVGEVENTDYKIAIDPVEGQARPTTRTKAISFDPVLTGENLSTLESFGLKKTGDCITLDYSETIAAAQPQISRTISVNPFDVYSWTGEVTLSPSSDFWYDETRRPAIVRNTEGVIDTVEYQRFVEANGGASGDTSQAFGTVWNNWQTVWTGNARTTRQPNTFGIRAGGGRPGRPGNGFFFGTTNIISTDIRENRTGLRTRAVTRVVNETISDRVVTQLAVPFIRSRKISFTAEKLKPETRFWAFFDGKNVTDHVTQINLTPATALLSDIAGIITGEYVIPNTPELRFNTGDRVFKLYNKNTIADATGDSSASATYRATGVLDVKQATILSTRVRDIVQDSVTESRERTLTTQAPVRNLFGRNVFGVWGHPIAESFFIDDVKTGSFITSIEVPFSQKDSNLPVTMQLRTMNNGFPGKEGLPFGNKTLYPDDVTVTTEAEADNGDPIVYTKFTFDSPVFVRSDTEYCFVLVSNSSKYRTWIAQMGDTDKVKNTVITKQPYAGVMFKSQNASTWSEDQLQDIAFKINRADFSTSVGSIDLKLSVPASDTGIPNTDPFLSVLSSGTIETVSGSSYVKITHPNHGFTVAPSGSESISQYTVKLDNSQVGNAIDFNGIAEAVMFDTAGHPIVYTSPDYYIINVSNSTETGSKVATSTGAVFTAEEIRVNNKVRYSIVHLLAQELIQGGTNVNWYITTDNQIPTGGTSDVHLLTANETTELYKGYSILNETTDYLTLTADLSRDADTSSLSPVIDVERIALLLSGYKINRTKTTPHVDPLVNDFSDLVEETEPSNNTNAARYIMRRATLNDTASAITVFVDANRPVNTEIDVYYRATASDGENFDETEWIEIDKTVYPGFSGSPSSLDEYEFSVEGIDAFTTFSIKVVLMSTDDGVAPILQDFRAIAMAI